MAVIVVVPIPIAMKLSKILQLMLWRQVEQGWTLPLVPALPLLLLLLLLLMRILVPVPVLVPVPSHLP